MAPERLEAGLVSWRHPEWTELTSHCLGVHQMLTQQPQPAGRRGIEISEATSQDYEDKIRMGAKKERDIGHI